MRRILVTGANKGIGLAIVKAILEEHDDTFVYLGSRDAERGEAAAATLGGARPERVRVVGGAPPAGGRAPERVRVVALDVASASSVTAASAKIASELAGERLYGIVNNAGIGRGSDVRDVLEVNILGVQRVCEAFLPFLQTRGGRIVNISSASGPLFVSSADAETKALLLDPQITWPRLRAFIDERSKTGADSDAYGLSKACLNAYTVLLAREHPELCINACTPGFIETDLTRPHAVAQGKSGAELGMKPPSAGARAPMFLLFGEPEGNGRYYGSDAVRSPLDRYRAPGAPAYDGR